MFFVAIPFLHLLFVLAPSEQPSRTWNLPRIDPASSPPKIRDEDKSALAAEGTVYHHILRSNLSESVFISGAVEAVKAVGNGEREQSVFQALWEGSLGLGTCLDRFHRAAVSTAWVRPESERSTSAAGTDFWKGLGWIQTGVWPALSVAAFERTTSS